MFYFCLISQPGQSNVPRVGYSIARRNTERLRTTVPLESAPLEFVNTLYP